MSESKGNSAGSKKLLIFFGLLILAAVIVVVIIVSIPANTYNMIDALQKNQETLFLNDNDERVKYDSFVNKINTNSTLSYYKEEAQDVIVISQNLSDILKYYNNYLVFAQKNKVLSSNVKVINKNIKSTNQIKKNIDEILDRVLKLEDESVSYLKNCWIDFRGEYQKYLDNYYSSFNALYNCYKDCFTTSFTNNKASDLILSTANDYISCLVYDFKTIVSVDTKTDIAQGDYSYLSHGRVVNFDKFVKAYINDNNEIKDYLFSSKVNDKYETLYTFFEIYSERDLKPLIASIDPTSQNVTKTYPEVNDPDKVYQEVADFLKGGK